MVEERSQKMHLAHRGKFVQMYAEGKILDVGAGRLFPWHDSMRKPDVCLDLEKRYSENISFVKGDAHNLPFKDSSFDTVVYAELLEHVESPRRCVEEALRVGKKLVGTAPSEKKP